MLDLDLWDWTLDVMLMGIPSLNDVAIIVCVSLRSVPQDTVRKLILEYLPP